MRPIDGVPNALSRIGRRLGSQPATVFLILSLAFGSIIIFADPPLRGPDEIAHFLRIYSYARGQLLPTTEVNGRKGIFVERELQNQLRFFRSAGERFARAEGAVRYGQIMAEYRELAGTNGDELDQPPTFMPFAGTEGYNPVAYLPYIAASAIGRLLRLNFVDMLLMMRIFGFLAFTAVAAYAVAVTPALKWAFVLIAMLPVSLYNRAVLSADGAALSCALVITALCLNAGRELTASRIWERSFWMTLCVLSKQPQIVFVLFELMVGKVKPWRWWHRFAIVVLPGLIMSPLWVIAVSADVAAWRVMEGMHYPPEQFDPLWKLSYMWEHPYHFPLAAWRALSGWTDRLWLELIGILGWQDILLPSWTYLVLTALLLIVPLQKLQVDAKSRVRLTVIAGLVVISYVVIVYLIFFLTYTPIDVDHVLGVQGRYFVIVLPAAAIFLAGAINVELPRGGPAVLATTGSLVAGIATVEAVIRAHW